jgi:hypothetical protein
VPPHGHRPRHRRTSTAQSRPVGPRQPRRHRRPRGAAPPHPARRHRGSPLLDLAVGRRRVTDPARPADPGRRGDADRRHRIPDPAPRPGHPRSAGARR